MFHDTKKCSWVTYSFSKPQSSIRSLGPGSGNSREQQRKLGQAPCRSGTFILFREAVNKQVEKYPNRKRSDGDNKQGDTVETAREERGGCCCGPNGQGGASLRR